jgi:hypothetical protein
MAPMTGAPLLKIARLEEWKKILVNNLTILE